MRKYFKDASTLEELRKQYKNLLKQYHPDNTNGSTEITQEVNAEYNKLFQVLKDKHDSNKAADASTTDCGSKYDFAEDEKLREVLQKIINFSGIEIELIGNWIWVDGNTYQYKKELKEIGFKWASQKKRWYFHTEAYRKLSRKNLSLNDIRNYYGSTKVDTENRRLLQA